MIKIFKFNKYRISFSIGSFFIKILISKKNLNCLNSKFKPADSNFNYLKRYFYKPNILSKIKFASIDFELQKHIKYSKALKGEEIKFIKKMDLIANEFDSKTKEIINWRGILYPEILLEIKNQKKTIYSFIESRLDNISYPLTGMHGDFNCNNILVDKKERYWIVDWELSTYSGSVKWDYCWILCDFLRKNSKPCLDINSIIENAKKKNFLVTEELLILYSILKFRNDLIRHNKVLEISLNNFYLRINHIMKIKNKT